MRRVGAMWTYTAGTLVSAIVFRFVAYPDSLFACLAFMFAVEIVTGVLRMCDNLLDPPPAIFLVLCQHENNLPRLPHMP